MARWASRLVGFLRAGYPAVLPRVGYVPLLALLPRRISDDELAAITTGLRLRTDRPSGLADVADVDVADVGAQITRVTHAMPSLDDIDRVKAHLVAAGGRGRRHG